MGIGSSFLFDSSVQMFLFLFQYETFTIIDFYVKGPNSFLGTLGHNRSSIWHHQQGSSTNICYTHSWSMSLMVHFSIMSFSSPVSEPFPGTRGSRGYFHHHGTYRKLRNNLRRQRSRKLITLERFNSSFQERQSYLHIQRDIRLDKDIGSNSLIIPHHTHTYNRDHPYKS